MVSSGAATLGGVVRGILGYVGLAVVVVLDGVEGGPLTTSALAALVSDALVRASVVVGSIPDGVGVIVRSSTCAGVIEGEWRLPLVSTAKETIPPISERGGGWQRWELPSHRLCRVSGGDLVMVVPQSTGWWRSNQAGVEGSWICRW